MDIHNEFIAQEKELYFYRGKDILNRRHVFTDLNGVAWDFSSATGFTFKVWEEREGGYQVIDWSSPTNLTNSTNEILLTAPRSDVDIERGIYYYEIEYILSGGYTVLLAFGRAVFI